MKKYIPSIRMITINLFILLFAVMLLPLSSYGAVAPVYERLTPIATSLTGPVGVALDTDGRLYVAETSANRVVVLSQGGSYVSMLAGLAEPISVAVDKDGRLYVGNKATNNVEVYDADFSLLHKLGTGDGEFGQPNGISIEPETGHVYVADKGNNVVKVFDADGTQVATIGSPGNGDGQFHNPLSVAIDTAKQELVVLDQQQLSGSSEEGARIQFFDMDGVYKRSFSRYNEVEGDMIRPQQLTVDRASRVYVTDSFQNVALVYEGDGTSLGAVYDLVNPMSIPLGVTIDATNRLYIASRLAGRIEVYGIDDYTRMAVDPLQLNFSGKEGDTAPAAQNLSVTNAGNATLNWSALWNESWLSLSDTNGILEAGQTVTLPVTVDPSALSPDEYSCSVVISGGPGVTEIVQIKLELEASRILSVTSSGLSFTSETGSAPAKSGTITIANSGSASMFWQISADQPWITLSRYSGRLADSAAGLVTVTVTADVMGLEAGEHSGKIMVSGYKAVGSPAALDVTLTLTDPSSDDSPPPISVPPAGTTWQGNMSRKWTVAAQLDGTALNGIWGSSSGDIFAVGDAGTIMHYNGRQWLQEDTGVEMNFNGVWGASASSVYAVGDNGLFLHYDGSHWNAIPQSFSGALHNVWCSDSKCLAVGDDLTVLEGTGTDSSWSVATSQTSAGALRGIMGLSDSDIYAVGDSGTIFHNDGTGWQKVDYVVNKDLYAVWGSSFDNVFAVGQGGTVLHYNGTAWKVVESVVADTLRAVWGNGANEVYAAGDNGTMLLYQGDRWRELETGVTENLNDVWGGRQKEIYAVGENGSILHGSASFPWELLMAVLEYNAGQKKMTGK